MVLRRFVFILSVFCISFSGAFAQNDAFCNAVTTILRDAPNKFRNVRGKALQASNNATIWDCSIKIPGTIGSRFVSSMGLFYEGALFQAPGVDGLKVVYEKYKDILNTCLAARGYIMTTSDNFYAGLSDYKKLVFMLEEKDSPAVVKPDVLPPHITMEATYSKEAGKYTIVLFIFEH